MTTSVQLSHLHPNRERRKNNCRFVHEKNIKRVLTSIVRYCIEIRILARTSTGLCWPTYPLTSYFLLPLASILDRTKKKWQRCATYTERACCVYTEECSKISKENRLLFTFSENNGMSETKSKMCVCVYVQRAN